MKDRTWKSSLAEVARTSAVPVIASGGVTTLEDVRRLKDLKMAGCIIGRAFYQGQLSSANSGSSFRLRNLMAKYKVEDIRNVALVGHGAAGKTSLADALLFKAKAVDRRGCVDDGTSVSDYDDEEKKQQILHRHQRPAPGIPGQTHLPDRHAPASPISSAPALGGSERRRHRRHRHLRPGRHRRSTRAACSPRPANAAWPACIVINRLDGDNIHFAELLEAHCRTPSARAASCSTLPIGVGPAFSGVVSVLNPPAKPPAGCPVDLAAERARSWSTPSSKATRP